MKASILRKDDVQALTGQESGQDLTSRQSETLTVAVNMLERCIFIVAPCLRSV
jgi:hypothetical protein